jgi:DNA repair protein SbcD/Mre11
MMGSTTLRLLHTSDWHLGHTLSDFPREEEHAAFLAWLLDTLEAEEIDALLIAGDVFETSNPPARALEQWFGFLGECRRRLPDLHVVAIGGNHDSAARLDSTNPLLADSRLHVVGGASSREARDLLVPIECKGTRAWIAAVPFLRISDLPVVRGEAPLVEGVRARYAEVFEEARAVRAEGEPIVAMGHLYMVGGQLSELSERKVLGGNQHAIPSDVFPSDVSYVALGHLHKAQRVGGDERARYSGSPLPLSIAEASYTHQVLKVTLAGEALMEVSSIRVPRETPIVRVPARGEAELGEILDLLAELPPRGELLPHRMPFVDVHVALDGPEPDLLRQIQDALADRDARLVRVERVVRGKGESLAASVVEESLRDLTPDEVFRRMHERSHGSPPEESLLAAFHEAVEAVAQGAR